MPPPFSAFQMLETLNILEGYDLRAWGHNSVDYLHHLIEAIKLASADRLAYAYGECGADRRDCSAKAYAASQRARIDPKRAAVSEGERHDATKLSGQIGEGYPAKFENEQTTHFACADAEGTVVSVTQTLGVPFGSGFAIPGTGIVLNNILKWSDRDPPSPNVLKPGRKAGTMMSPTQVFRDGAFRAVDRHARLVRHPPDAAADAAQRPGVRHERAGGDRGAAHPHLSRSPARRRGAHPRGGARGGWPRAATR